MSGFPIEADAAPPHETLSAAEESPHTDVPAPETPKTAGPVMPQRRLLLSLLTLCGAGLSLVLLLQTFSMLPDMQESFLLRNGISKISRQKLLISALLGGALPLLASLVAIGVARQRAVSWIHFLGRVLGPLIPLSILPPLLSVSFGHQNQMIYGLVLAGFVVMFEPLLRASLGELAAAVGPSFGSSLGNSASALRWSELTKALPKPSPRVTFFVLVLLACTGYAVFMSFFTIRNHHRLGTTAFDLGIYDNLMYNALHGRPFVSPVLFGPAGGNYIAGHAEFAMLLFVPFYAIHPGPETMLIIQAVVLGFAAVPLYLFAATRLPRSVSAVIAIAYLLYAPLHGPNFYDFHWIPLAIFFHFWLYYAIATRKTWLAIASVVVLYAIREDVAVGLALLGLFLVFTGLRLRFGLILAICSVAWFAIVRFIIMPLAGSWYFQNLYNALFAEGVSTFGSVIKTIITNPVYAFGTLLTEQKLIYVLHMMAPLAFLPLRRLPLLLLAISGMFFTILTTGYSPTVQISFQYTTHWIPYLFLATVLALTMISAETNGIVARRAALMTMAVAMFVHSYNFGAMMQHEAFVGGFSRIEFKMSVADDTRYRELKELLAMIPPNASVAATEQETAHISTRRVAYPLRWAPGPVDYLLIGRSHIGDLSRTSVDAALANPQEYGLLASRGEELFLFKRHHQSPDTPLARMKVGVR